MQTVAANIPKNIIKILTLSGMRIFSEAFEPHLSQSENNYISIIKDARLNDNTASSENSGEF